MARYSLDGTSVWTPAGTCLEPEGSRRRLKELDFLDLTDWGRSWLAMSTYSS